MPMNVQGVETAQPQKHHRLRATAIMTTGLAGGTYAGGKLCVKKAGDKLIQIVDTFVDSETGDLKLYNNNVMGLIDFEKANESQNLPTELKNTLKTLSELKNLKKGTFTTGAQMSSCFAALSDSKELLEKEGILNAEAFDKELKSLSETVVKAAKSGAKILGKYIGGGMLAGGLVAFGVNKLLKSHDKKEAKEVKA